jgi:uncharacterized protein (DUF1684 family)
MVTLGDAAHCNLVKTWLGESGFLESTINMISDLDKAKSLMQTERDGLDRRRERLKETIKSLKASSTVLSATAAKLTTAFPEAAKIERLKDSLVMFTRLGGSGLIEDTAASAASTLVSASSGIDDSVDSAALAAAAATAIVRVYNL